MRANEERPAQGPTALHQLRDLKFRRGRKVRQQREKLYREALQELMTEFQRATQVPHEDVAELSKLTGHRTSSIRRDLFRTQITAPAEEPSSD